MERSKLPWIEPLRDRIDFHLWEIRVTKEELPEMRRHLGRLTVNTKYAYNANTVYVILNCEVDPELHITYLDKLDGDVPCKIVESTVKTYSLVCES